MSTEDPPLRLYVIAWIPLAAVYTALFLASGATPAAALRWSLVSVLPFLLLGLIVLPAPGHVRWLGDRRVRFFTAHLGLALAYGVAGTAGVFGLRKLEALLVTGRAEAASTR
jgi:cytochrome c oxidase subunit IV